MPGGAHSEKRLSQKGQPLLFELGQKKEEDRGPLLSARRYLAFVITKSKVIFKDYAPNQTADDAL